MKKEWKDIDIGELSKIVFSLGMSIVANKFMGVDNGNHVRTLVGNIIKGSTPVIKENVTFGEFHGKTHRHLIVTVCDLASNTEVYVNTLDPKFANVKVVDAVCASMAIPVVYTPVQLFDRPDHFPKLADCVDGGTVDNLPLMAIKDKKELQEPLAFVLDSKENVTNTNNTFAKNQAAFA